MLSTCRKRGGSERSTVWPGVETLEQRETPSVTGVYSLPAVYALGARVDAPLPRLVRENLDVTGIALRARWNALETADGVYDFRYLTNQIRFAAAAGKKVSLNILVGCHTPAWVYTAGAVPFRFDDPARPCNRASNQQTMPIPWDPVFTAKWTRFIAVLGQQFGNDETVTHVKITGVNKTSAETALPGAAADALNWVSPTLPEPLRYRPSRMHAAWETYATAFSQAFPTKSIAAMLRPGAFPLLGENGQTVARGEMEANVDHLIGRGITLFGAEQFIAQNNGLKSCWIYNKVANVSAQIVTGYQMNKAVTFDDGVQMATCNPPPDPPIVGAVDALQAAVDLSLAHGARFLEIYQRDITNPALADVIAYAHAMLGRGAGPGPGGATSPPPAADLGWADEAAFATSRATRVLPGGPIRADAHPDLVSILSQDELRKPEGVRGDVGQELLVSVTPLKSQAVDDVFGLLAGGLAGV